MPPRRSGEPGRSASRRRGGALRPDTTLAPAVGVGELGAEVYVWGLPGCCLRSLKEAVVRGPGDGGGGGRGADLRCASCGRRWVVAGSLDEKVLGRFVVRGEALATEGAAAGGGSGGSGSAA